MPKCRFCKKEISAKEAVFDDSGKRKIYYCSEEHKAMDKEKKIPVKETSGEEKKNPRRDLTDYILEIYLENGYDRKEINWDLITSQMKNMMESNEMMVYSGMKYCLWYMYEIAKVNLFQAKGNTIISLLPFYYEESKKYYLKAKEIKDAVKEFDFNIEPIIYVTSAGHYDYRGRRRKEIDMTTLVEEKLQ